jgi:tetratricopeptide (TPR) repeat protein
LKRSLRKQIKQDELVSGWEQVEGWTRVHQNELRASAIAVALLIVGLGALWLFRSQRHKASQDAFDQALTGFQAPIAAEIQAQGANPAGASSREEKYRKALAGFDGVAERYGSLDAGIKARYYAALCRIELGELEAAEKGLREVVARDSGGKDIVAASARLALAGLLRRKGAAAEAVSEYEKALGSPASPLPEDHLLFALAGALEEAGRSGEASAAYRRVVNEHPDSRYAQDARARADYLKPAAKG